MPLEASDAPIAMMVTTIDQHGVLSTRTQGFDIDQIEILALEMDRHVHSILNQVQQVRSAAG
jgi:glycine cleavage system regulatory protein